MSFMFYDFCLLAAFVMTIALLQPAHLMSIRPIKGIMLCLIMLVPFTVNALPSINNDGIMQETATSSDSIDIAIDPYGRQTPRNMVNGFLGALQQNDTELAQQYLQIEADIDTATIIQDFKKILDNGGRLHNELNISNDPMGSLTDKLPTEMDEVGSFQHREQTLPFLVVRTVSEDGIPIWQFSQETIAQVPTFAEHIQPSWVERNIPPSLLEKYVLGYSIGQVVAATLMLIVSFLISYFITWGLFLLANLLSPKLFRERTAPINNKLILPLTTIIASSLFKETLVLAGVSVTVRNPFNRLIEIIGWIAFAWLMLRFADVLSRRAVILSQANDNTERLSFITLVRKIIKVLIIIFAAIYILGNFGFDLTTGIAALGVGGLALALGAQKTIENLVGSLVLVIDQPIRVGDFCSVGNYSGTVEDVGIRSTRLRTLNHTIVTIPNGKFSSLEIENYTQNRHSAEFQHHFYFQRETPNDVIKALLIDLRGYLDHSNVVIKTSSRAVLFEATRDAINIQIYTHVYATGLHEFLHVQEKLLLDILDIIALHPVEYAVPAQRVLVDEAEVAKIERQKQIQALNAELKSRKIQS